MEHKQIYPVLLNHKIIGYFRYVDDILLIYNQNETNIDEMLAEFNKQQPTIKFTIEKETHKSINFLDLTIQRQEQKLEYAIYRKPTQTDIIIPNDSCHPHEHKISSINYLMNRLNTYPISEEAKKKELNTIKNTLENNKYDKNKSKPQPKPKKQNTNNEQQHKKKTKWATFTYNGKETKQITKLFKDTNIKIAYKTRNTIQN
jgi:hypothetical protein